MDDVLTIATFGLLTCLPLLVALMAPPADESSMENRRLAELPEFGTAPETLERLPAALEDWYDDRMGFRETLIRWHALIWIKGLGVSPSNVVAVGADGWLFNSGPRLLAQYRGADPFSPSELEHWRRIFEERQQWLASQGIGYLVILVPTKARIYPEFLPRWIEPGTSTPFQELARHIAQHSEVAVLDLEDALLSAKPSKRLYHRTDIHWNDEGGYVAYQAILAALRAQLPALSAERPVRVERRVEQSGGLGLAALFGLEDVFEEDLLHVWPAAPRAPLTDAQRAAIRSERRAFQRIVLGVGESRLPRAVVFRDSFASALMPFLSEHFERIVFDWTADVDRQLVLRERPDVVIQEMWAGSIDSPSGRRPRARWETPARPWMVD